MAKGIESASNSQLEKLLGQSGADVMNSVGESIQYHVYKNLPGRLGESGSAREEMWDEYRDWRGRPCFVAR